MYDNYPKLWSNQVYFVSNTNLFQMLLIVNFQHNRIISIFFIKNKIFKIGFSEPPIWLKTQWDPHQHPSTAYTKLEMVKCSYKTWIRKFRSSELVQMSWIFEIFVKLLKNGREKMVRYFQYTVFNSNDFRIYLESTPLILQSH